MSCNCSQSLPLNQLGGAKKLLKKDLLERAKAKEIKGRSKMTVAQLRKALGMKPLKKC